MATLKWMTRRKPPEMNAQCWLETDDPVAMLVCLDNLRPPGERKLRLLSLACWWHSYHGPNAKPWAWEDRRWAEAWIDRGCPRAEVDALDVDLGPYPPRPGKPPSGLWRLLAARPYEAAVYYLHAPSARLAALVRDVMGSPFGSVGAVFQPPPRPVADTARAIYDEHSFADLPVLADALEDWGAWIDPQILEHLRSPGPHVRGCWALDLVLGKR